MSKKIIVIGVGIAGLTASVYAQRSGFDVTLIEQHSIVGGMCTSWKRKGYLFEGAVHWLTGSSPQSQMYQVWKDTGALGDDVQVSLSDPFSSIEHKGQIINLYRDINKTVEDLKEISPDDKLLLNRLAKDVKTLSKMQMPIMDIKGVKAKNPKRMTLGFILNILPAIPTMRRLNKLTCADFSEKFTHPAIKRLFRLLLPAEYAASSLIFTLATLHAGDGGYPDGGSLAMVHRMAKTFTDMGGKLLLNTQVQKVNISTDDVAGKGVVTGVTLQDEVLEADAVIVTQETVAALKQLFETPPNDEWIIDMKANLKSAICTFISIGVRAELPAGILPAWKLNTPITFADKTIHELSFNSYRQYAPNGGTALTTISFGDTYDFWEKAKNEGRYEQEKQSLAKQYTHALCEKYPECEGKIEVVDIATPLTYERYTGAYRGAWMSIMEPGDAMKQYSGDCNSISGLFFSGHRLVPPGGLPSAAASGRKVAQMVCKHFNVVFE